MYAENQYYSDRNSLIVKNIKSEYIIFEYNRWLRT